MQDQVPVLSIKLTKPGVELVLNALAQLPFAQSAGLIREIEAQANMQLEMIRKAAEAAQAPAAPTPSTDAETAPSAPADPVPAAAKKGKK